MTSYVGFNVTHPDAMFIQSKLVPRAAFAKIIEVLLYTNSKPYATTPPALQNLLMSIKLRLRKFKEDCFLINVHNNAQCYYKTIRTNFGCKFLSLYIL